MGDNGYDIPDTPYLLSIARGLAKGGRPAASANAKERTCSVTDINSFAKEISSSFHKSSLFTLDNKY
jgi:hypothetical protein